MPEKLTEARAVILLRRKLASGDISKETNPKQIWVSDPIFMEHKLDNFRTKRNKIKTKYFGNDDSDPAVLRPRCTVDAPPEKRQQVTLGDDDSSESCDRIIVKKEIISTHLFQPLHLISTWTEPGTTTKCVTIAILLPSGVGAGSFSVRVLEGGRELELTVRWPQPLSDLSIMHRKWLTATDGAGMEVYHPRYIGFEHALKAFRERSSDSVDSHCKLALPFPVQTHIYAKYNLGWRDSDARMVYIDLKALQENYSFLRDENSFEIC